MSDVYGEWHVDADMDGDVLVQFELITEDGVSTSTVAMPPSTALQFGMAVVEVAQALLGEQT